MDKMKAKLDLLNQAKKRMKSLCFGDSLTNVSLCYDNPRRHLYFVELKTKRLPDDSTQYCAKCTDRNGKFWETDINVMFPGHLERKECVNIYGPIHDAYFGDNNKINQSR